MCFHIPSKDGSNHGRDIRHCHGNPYFPNMTFTSVTTSLTSTFPSVLTSYASPSSPVVPNTLLTMLTTSETSTEPSPLTSYETGISLMKLILFQSGVVLYVSTKPFGTYKVALRQSSNDLLPVSNTFVIYNKQMHIYQFW